MKRLLNAAIATALILSATAAFGLKDPMVGGAATYPSRDIVQNAVHSKAHTTLVAAVKAAGLVKTLERPGPFTVFAPTNQAFRKLPAGTVANLLKPQNKDKLAAILEYHVVPGRITTMDLTEMIRKGHGKAMLKTVQGSELTFKMRHGHYFVIDKKGDTARITIPNVYQSNGMIQVIDTVLIP